MKRSPIRGIDSRRTRGRFVTSAAVRKRKQRSALRARGFVLRQVWVHPRDWPRVRKKLRALFVKRGGRDVRSKRSAL